VPDLEFKVTKTQKKLSDIHVADYNPRKSVHDDPEFYERLYKSITTFDYIDPIIINTRDGKNVIVGGNQRYTVLCDMAEDAGLGLNEVFVDVIEKDYDEQTEMAANIALNRISGDWIQDKLKEDLEYIRGLDEDLAVAAGFSIAELDKLEEELTEKEDLTVKPKFTIHISLPQEYESYYDFYMSTHSEEDLKKALISIITK
jgi:ParB-like chromosome segregation protein Spo0J